MDLSRLVGYRGFQLNGIAHDAVSRDMKGCEITDVRMGVSAVGYDEKRAFNDGFDASDVTLGKRIIELQGNLLGRAKAEAYDLLQDFRKVMHATDAYEAAEGQKGFHALDFYVPTLDTDFPSGEIHQIMMVRPTALPVIDFVSDALGGVDSDAMAIPWSVSLEAIDPRIYGYDLQRYSLAGAGFSGVIRNKGNRPAPVVVRLTVGGGYFGPNMVGDSLWVRMGFGQQRLNITIPYKQALQTLEYDSNLGLLRLYRNGKIMVRQDLFTLSNGHIMLRPGNTAVTLVRQAPPAGGGGNFRTDSWIDTRSVWA